MPLYLAPVVLPCCQNINIVLLHLNWIIYNFTFIFALIAWGVISKFSFPTGTMNYFNEWLCPPLVSCFTLTEADNAAPGHQEGEPPVLDTGGMCDHWHTWDIFLDFLTLGFGFPHPVKCYKETGTDDRRIVGSCNCANESLHWYQWVVYPTFIANVSLSL